MFKATHTVPPINHEVIVFGLPGHIAVEIAYRNVDSVWTRKYGGKCPYQPLFWMEIPEDEIRAESLAIYHAECPRTGPKRSQTLSE